MLQFEIVAFNCSWLKCSRLMGKTSKQKTVFIYLEVLHMPHLMTFVSPYITKNCLDWQNLEFIKKNYKLKKYNV